MWIVTYFHLVGDPVEGLSPRVRVRDIEADGLVVASGIMDDLGDGIYAYEFTGYDITGEYAILCDAVDLPDNYRYKHLASGEYGDVIDTVNILSDNVDIRTLLIRKILTNKLELLDGGNAPNDANWILYDDDSATVVATWDVTDKGDGDIEQEEYTDAKRSKGV
jgi:hypothetical protein